MATIVNNPPAGQQSESNSGGMFLIGAIILLVTVFLFFYYGVPAMRNAASSVPTQQGGTSVEVPDQIDVNVSGSTEGGE